MLYQWPQCARSRHSAAKIIHTKSLFPDLVYGAIAADRQGSDRKALQPNLRFQLGYISALAVSIQFNVEPQARLRAGSR
jgi:hypothetical protein